MLDSKGTEGTVKRHSAEAEAEAEAECTVSLYHSRDGSVTFQPPFQIRLKLYFGSIALELPLIVDPHQTIPVEGDSTTHSRSDLKSFYTIFKLTN
jgi:hypothetical protein